MPLRCWDQNRQDIHAFDKSSDEWARLAVQNRSERHLLMPCCSAHVTLRTSRLGTQFFAHRAVGACRTAPETDAHLHLKQIAVQVARAHGWTAQTEISGASPDGEAWVADVLARKDRGSVAVELQWSSQSPQETLRRQCRYRASGIRGLWLLRKTYIPATRELPAAMIARKLDQSYEAVLSSGQTMAVRDFLDAAFSGRLKYGVPKDAAGLIVVRAAPVKCWHNRCGAETTIITGIDLVFGPYKRELPVAQFDGYERMLRYIVKHLPADLRIGAIKRRSSKSVGSAYLSNGCVRCDRLYGEHFEVEARYEVSIGAQT